MSDGGRPNNSPRNSKAQLYFAAGGLEPPLDEVLSDPIVQLIARRDGASIAELRQIIAAFRAARRDGK